MKEFSDSCAGRHMRSPVAFRVGNVLAVLLFAAATLAAGQEQAPKAGEQSAPVKEFKGTVASMDRSCTSFVLETEADGTKTESEFSKDGDIGSWVREPAGCNIVFDAQDKMLLKPG